MFDFIRKHSKITMGLLFLLIVPSFVLLGLKFCHSNFGAVYRVLQIDYHRSPLEIGPLRLVSVGEMHHFLGDAVHGPGGVGGFPSPELC